MAKMLTANDIMNPDVLSVEAGMSVRELASFLIEHEISGAPVLDDGRLVGVVSVTDIAQTASEDASFGDPRSDYYSRGWEFKIERDEMNRLHIENEGRTVAEIMTPTVYTIAPETSASEIAKTMIAGRIHRLLVARGSEVVGIITSLDLLKVIADHE